MDHAPYKYARNVALKFSHLPNSPPSTPNLPSRKAPTIQTTPTFTTRPVPLQLDKLDGSHNAVNRGSLKTKILGPYSNFNEVAGHKYTDFDEIGKEITEFFSYTEGMDFLLGIETFNTKFKKFREKDRKNIIKRSKERKRVSRVGKLVGRYEQLTHLGQEASKARERESKTGEDEHDWALADETQKCKFIRKCARNLESDDTRKRTDAQSILISIAQGCQAITRKHYTPSIMFSPLQSPFQSPIGSPLNTPDSTPTRKFFTSPKTERKSQQDSFRRKLQLSIAMSTNNAPPSRASIDDSNDILPDMSQPLDPEALEYCATNSKLLRQCNTLPYVFSCLERVLAWHSDSCKKLISTTPNNPQPDIISVSHIPTDSNYWHTARELRQLLNIIFLIVANHREDKDFVRHCFFESKVNNQPFIVVLFELIGGKSLQYIPHKKVLILIRWCILLNLGPVGQSSNIEEKDDENFKRTKARMKDVESVCKHCSDNFAPLLVTKRGVHNMPAFLDPFSDPDITIFQGVPESMAEGINITKAHLHHTKSEENLWHAIKQNLTNGEEKQNRDCSVGSDLVQLRCDCPSLIQSPANDLYGLLVRRLKAYVTGLLKLLLAAAPNVKILPNMIGLHQECLIFPNVLNQAPQGCAEIIRQKEIVLKSVSSILLSLLKHWKATHMAQFLYLRGILQDKNTHVLILKFLNQNLASSSMQNTDYHHLSFLSPSLWDQTAESLLTEIRESTELPMMSWRKCHSYINIMRILQKITKSSPVHLKSLVRFKAPLILQKILRTRQPDLTWYSLKLFKSQIKYLGRKWKANNMDIITQIFHKLPMNLNDDWMISYMDENKPQISLRRQKDVHKDIRTRCMQFNHAYQRHTEQQQEKSRPEFRVADGFDYEAWLESEVYNRDDDYSNLSASDLSAAEQYMTGDEDEEA